MELLLNRCLACSYDHDQARGLNAILDCCRWSKPSTASPPHRLTASPPHCLTASPPHRLTAAPPHCHTASLPHHLTSSPLVLSALHKVCLYMCLYVGLRVSDCCSCCERAGEATDDEEFAHKMFCSELIAAVYQVVTRLPLPPVCCCCVPGSY